MNNEETIILAKEMRVELDVTLQKMKTVRKKIMSGVRLTNEPHVFDQEVDAYDQITLSIHDLEGSIMRLGMVLKAVGNASPYPNSYNPSNSIVEPTADGLKL